MSVMDRWQTFHGYQITMDTRLLWNNLPVELRQWDVSLGQFKRLLKMFLFRWDSHIFDFVFKCAMYKYTYLLTYLYLTICFQHMPGNKMRPLSINVMTIMM